ncbi:MAG TPA: penicillin-binding transpeptidase domain-containing protein, partial [Rhodothermales bacterium]|nr:penicillin-binding transpeptidase domain-containing protein [Rhodothermales bacterium]
GGTFQLKEALKWSKNGAAVNLMMSIGSGRSQDCGGSEGPQRVAELARKNGLSIPQTCVVPSLALGICEVTLLQLTNAYATLADGGKMRAPRYLERIEDANGNVVAEFGAPSARQTIHPRAAYDVLDMMRGTVRGGTGQAINAYLGNPRFDLAGKTGTTQHGSDGWFMLMHPNLVMGAWVGFDTPTISWRSDYYQQGSHTALPIVGSFFRQVRDVRRNLLDPDAKFAEVTIPLPKPARGETRARDAAPTRTRPRARSETPVEEVTPQPPDLSPSEGTDPSAPPTDQAPRNDGQPAQPQDGDGNGNARADQRRQEQPQDRQKQEEDKPPPPRRRGW